MITTKIYSSKNGEDSLELYHNGLEDELSIYAQEGNNYPESIEFHRDDLIEFAKQILKVCKR